MNYVSQFLCTLLINIMFLCTTNLETLSKFEDFYELYFKLYTLISFDSKNFKIQHHLFNYLSIHVLNFKL